MRWILGSSLRFGRLVIALAVGLIVFGVAQLKSAPTDVYPEFMPPSVEIQTEALGLSAQEVEQLITVPLEQDLLNGVPWLDKIHSTSRPGLSAIDLTFQPGTDVYAARQMVQERMTQAHALPNVGSPPLMIQPLASNSRVAMIGLGAKAMSLSELSVLTRWKIRPLLMGVPGVANVSVYGQRDRQLQVQVDPKTLHAKGVTLSQVIQTAGNALWVSPLTFLESNTPGTGGFLESPQQRLSIQHISPITTSKQLADVPVEGVTGAPPKLSDVASVIEDHQPLIGDAVADGTPSLFLVVEKFPGANTLEVTKGVEAAMAAMKPGLGGVTVDTSVYRPATFLESATRNLGLAALFGFGGLLLLIGLLISWRSALVGAVVVPVSLTAAAYVLYLRGETLTSVTALALSAAVIWVVDDVVTDVTASRRRPATPDAATAWQHDRLVAAFAATRGPLMFATVAIVVAAVPFLVVTPLVSAFSYPLIVTYLLAVAAATLVSLTLTPTLTAALPAPAGPARGTGSLWRGVDRLLAGTSRRRAWAVAAVLAAGSLALIPQFGRGSLLPAPQDRNLLLRLTTAPSTSLPEMDRITGRVTADLRSLPGVTSVGAHVGRAVTSDQVVNVNAAEVWVTVADGADYDRTRAAIAAVGRSYPGVATDLVTYAGDRVKQAAGHTDDLLVRIYGEDLTTLQQKANEVGRLLTGIPGVTHPAVRSIPMQPTVDIQVDLPKAQQYGLRPGDVRRDATTLSSGLTVGSLYEQSKVFDVVVWGDPKIRGSLTTLGNLAIDTPSGGSVALKDVATVSVKPEPTAITHDDVRRSIEIAAGISGDPGAVTDAVRARMATLAMPFEYHAEVFGGATAARSDLLRLLGYGTGALAIVFLLLQAAAGSWRRGVTLLLSVALSVVGGLIAAPLAGGIWNVGALAGLFAVLALALRHAVLLIRAVRDAECDATARGDGAISPAMRAVRERSGPVVETVLISIGALVPVVLLANRAGLETVYPMAVTVLGGLLSLLAVQLLVLPGLLRSALPVAPWPPVPQPALPGDELVPA
jgi:Cu/Ag efflux pump CusA